MSKDNSPAVSCILPVHNSEKFLAASINSVLTQDFRDFELIIIDDGSTDKSPLIIEQARASDPRVSVIRQENKGIVAALNAGLSAARGEFIARMDADDVCLPERFTSQWQFLMQNPDVVLVGGLARMIDSQGKCYAISTGNRHHATNLLCFPPKVVTVVHPLAMFRASALKAIGGYSSLFLHAEDYEIFMRMSHQGRIAHVDKVMLEYRFHSENISLKWLQLQERNAALAEIEQVQAARRFRNKRRLRLAAATFEAYVAIRTIRREFNVGKYYTASAFSALLLKIVRGSLASEPYTTSRLLLMLGFHAIRTIKAKALIIRPFLIFQ